MRWGTWWTSIQIQTDLRNQSMINIILTLLGIIRNLAISSRLLSDPALPLLRKFSFPLVHLWPAVCSIELAGYKWPFRSNNVNAKPRFQRPLSSQTKCPEGRREEGVGVEWDCSSIRSTLSDWEQLERWRLQMVVSAWQGMREENGGRQKEFKVALVHVNRRRLPHHSSDSWKALYKSSDANTLLLM